MGQAMPPVGVREHYAQRERIRQTVADAGSKGLTLGGLRTALVDDVPVLLEYHLFRLADNDQVEWYGPAGRRRVRVRKDAP